MALTVRKQLSNIPQIELEGAKAEQTNRKIKSYLRLEAEVKAKMLELEELKQSIYADFNADTLKESVKISTSQVGFTFSYVKPSVCFNSKQFKAENSALYEQYRTLQKAEQVKLIDIVNKTTC